MRTDKEMFDLILSFANKDDRVRAAYLYGSKADPNIEKDKYQDYDIVFVVTETSSFISDKDWIKEFGEVAFIFEGLWNQIQFNIGVKSIDFERRYIWSMLLDDGNRIDLVMEIKDEALKNYADKSHSIILLDKDNCLPDKLAPVHSDIIEKPTEDKYAACCNGFWWFLGYVAKGIARDELPFAMGSYNEFIRLTLNQMLDWYIGTLTDFSVLSGKRGKYYKKYLPVELYTLYEKSYSDSNYTNFWNAIFSSCDLFKKMAHSVSDYFNFSYDSKAESAMLKYILKIKDGTL